MRHAKSLLLAAALLAACAPRPGPDLLAPADAATGARSVTVLSATNRSPAPPAGFGNGRGTLSHASFTVAVAPRRGTDSARDLNRDLARDFVITDRKALDRAAFLRSARQQRGRVVLFVHGFNTNFQEALFRLAQVAADSGSAAQPVLFAWPSEGRSTAYLTDRDGATYARDDLAGLIADLAQAAPGRVTVIGHSMGAWLVMEALRQLSLDGRRATLRQLRVGLAAPDIDLDVFRAQVAAVGRLDPPMTVLVRHDDRALALSSRISGNRPRLGAMRIDDPALSALAAQAGLKVIDLSTLPSADRLNHDRLIVLAEIASSDPSGGFGYQLRQSSARVLDAAGTLLSAPFEGLSGLITGR